MTATESHEQYVARLQRAQAELLAKLKNDVADRPAHVRYLRRLLEAPADQLDDVPRPGGVNVRMGAALLEDVAWLRQPAPEPGWLINPYPGAYLKRRIATSRSTAKQLASKQARREGTAPSLKLLLKLKGS